VLAAPKRGGGCALGVCMWQPSYPDAGSRDAVLCHCKQTLCMPHLDAAPVVFIGAQRAPGRAMAITLGSPVWWWKYVDGARAHQAVTKQ
jgi:hypothetical protein